MLMTWSRVGSLTCLSRLAARWMVFVRRTASCSARAAFDVGFFILRIAGVIGIRLLRRFDRQEAGHSSPSPRGGHGDRELRDGKAVLIGSSIPAIQRLGAQPAGSLIPSASHYVIGRY